MSSPCTSKLYLKEEEVWNFSKTLRRVTPHTSLRLVLCQQAVFEEKEDGMFLSPRK